MNVRTTRHVWERRRAVILALAVIVLFVLHLSMPTRAARRIPVRGSVAVGVLLRGAHRPFCTASIVNSPRGDLILTAAHCLGRTYASAPMFAPAYHDGAAPFGKWKVTGQVFAPGWLPGGNVNRDFAFLTVRGDVQARAGAEELGYSSPAPATVRLEGYSQAGRLTICDRRPGTYDAGGQQQLRLACPGYSNASSGAPFLTDINGQSGLGTIVGVIGGYQKGGDSPSVSYSSPFDAVIHDLYGSLTAPGGSRCCRLPTMAGSRARPRRAGAVR